MAPSTRNVSFLLFSMALLGWPSQGAASEGEGGDGGASARQIGEVSTASQRCGRGVGAAGGGQRTGLRWDFVSGGAVSWSSSAMLGLWCERALGEGSLQLFGAVDAVPTYLHFYNQLERRQPLWLLGRVGVSRQVGRHHSVGVHATTNLAVFGSGIHGRVGLPWGGDASNGEDGHALDLRVDVLSGQVPGVQLAVLYDLQVRRWP